MADESFTDHPGRFDPGVENWNLYLSRFKIYCQLKGDKLPAASQGLALLNGLGAQTVELLTNLISPLEIHKMTVKEIDDALKTHYETNECQAAHRFKFWKRDQQSGEPMKDYIAEIRRLALPCKFGNALNDLLRDKLIFGIRSSGIQKRLLMEDIDFKKAEEMARSMESATQNILDMNSLSSGAVAGDGVQAVKAKKLYKRSSNPWGSRARRGIPRQTSSSSEEREEECDACGAVDHSKKNCRFRTYICRRCEEKGHLAKVCPEKKKPNRCTWIQYDDDDDNNICSVDRMLE